jgi:hypothetical protein
MPDHDALTGPAKLMLLLSLLSKDRIITNNGKALLKELVLSNDPRLSELMTTFERKSHGDRDFLSSVHKLVDEEGRRLHNKLYHKYSLEVGKSQPIVFDIRTQYELV